MAANFDAIILQLFYLSTYSNISCLIFSILALFHTWMPKINKRPAMKELKRKYQCHRSWKWTSLFFELSLITSLLNFALFMSLDIGRRQSDGIDFK